MNAAIECWSIDHRFEGPTSEQAVLRDVSLTLGNGDTCVLLGPSGSGKTTLLSIMGCLLRPTAGDVLVAGQSLDWRDAAQLARMRRRQIGFIFQHARLLPFLTVSENVALAGENAGTPDVQKRVDALLARLDLSDAAEKRPGELSGGQRQRIAVARALVHAPAVVLADEPTASLDWDNGAIVVDLLLRHAKEAGAAVLTVTHDQRLIPRFQRAYTLDRGRLVNE